MEPAGGSRFDARRRIAIVAVHGIGPQQRYGIQDEIATQLQAELNALSGRTWELDVFFPTADQSQGAAQPDASALRLYQRGDDKENPARTAFDVYEGYWSPIDKNRTSVRAVLSWLLKATFVPLTTSARLPATGSKLAFDVAYTICAVALLIGSGAAFLAALLLTDAHLTSAPAQTGIFDLIHTVVTDPFSLLSKMTPQILAALICTTAGGFAWAQAAVSWLVLRKEKRSAPASDFAKKEHLRAQKWRARARWILIALGTVLVACGAWQTKSLIPLGFVAAMFLLRAYLSLANDFFVNRLGDVQIYTTRDNNSQYFGMRESILDSVQKTIAQVIQTRSDRCPKVGEYERVYLLAHSLGSTIAMDALIRLHQHVEGRTLSAQDWRRIRGLVTFGTALEKTKFFFDVQNPTLSQQYQQWRNDVDGHLFTDDLKALEDPNLGAASVGIFWANYWYARDIVANEIRTYRSKIGAGSVISAFARKAVSQARVTCCNVELKDKFSLRSLHVWVHSDYFADANFWTGRDKDGTQVTGVLDILTS